MQPTLARPAATVASTLSLLVALCATAVLLPVSASAAKYVVVTKAVNTVAPGAAAVAGGAFDIVTYRHDVTGFVRDAQVPHDEHGVGGLAIHALEKGGAAEFIVGSGAGAVPAVRVLRADGTQVSAFPAFSDAYRADVRVAAGDLDGDGAAEIAASTGAGPSARVRVFDASGKARSDGFLPYGAGFRGGVAIAVGDWNGDGRADIATVPSSSGGPHVRLWDASGHLTGEFSAFDAGAVGDYDVAAGDLDGDGKDELVVARTDVGNQEVRVFAPSTGALLRSFVGGPKDSGATVAVGDADGDGKSDILLVGGATSMSLYAYAFDGTLESQTPVADLHGMARAAVGPLGASGIGAASTRVAVAAFTTGDAKNDAPKYVEVDVSEQRLRAYEHGKLVKTFLVATGMKKYPTPIGDFSVLEKPFKVNYKWNYGAGNPDNYDLGWVTWNLRFQPHVYIHYAPWRSRFGVAGSHGCVNVSKADAQWIYAWGEVGMPVTVRE
ncbi:MAG: hypothetical protein RLZZ324_1318 [Candidatus Parcubacteria bacterium]|jgi:lipoprotein-anchoring transpeptidase ErfK/SrfK